MSGPLFFVDRSLGRVRAPALLRESGWSLVTLSEHYGIPHDETVADVEWIRCRTAERRALIAHGVRAFCLTSGNLTASAVADCFTLHQDQIWTEAIADEPALFADSTSTVRPVALDE